MIKLVANITEFKIETSCSVSNMNEQEEYLYFQTNKVLELIVSISAYLLVDYDKIFYLL